MFVIDPRVEVPARSRLQRRSFSPSSSQRLRDNSKTSTIFTSDQQELEMRALLKKGSLRDALVGELDSAGDLMMAIAMISRNGLARILKTLSDYLERGCRGRVLLGTDLATDPDAIEDLLHLQQEHPGKFVVRRFDSVEGCTFHPKAFLFKRASGSKIAILGSANLTLSGFEENIEVGVSIEDRKVVEALWEYLEELFEGGRAKEVDEQWLAGYRKLWNDRARLLSELNDLSKKARELGPSKKEEAQIPRRIKGGRFLFTGKLSVWTRSQVCDLVKELEGEALTGDASAGTVHCLVHGELLGGRTSTRKLQAARKEHTPVISEDQFRAILASEQKCRRGKRS